MKPIIEELWKKGHQTLFYAEGKWDEHLKSFTELPDRSIVYHVDRGDIFKAHDVLGDKFCLSGGISNFLLSYKTPDDVRECCKKVIDGVAKDGGYIMDASAIMQNDTKVENLKALTDFTREYGVYSSGSVKLSPSDKRQVVPEPGMKYGSGYGMVASLQPKVPAGVCIPWEQKVKEIPQITGNRELVETIWNNVEGFGNMFIWQCLLSF